MRHGTFANRLSFVQHDGRSLIVYGAAHAKFLTVDIKDIRGTENAVHGNRETNKKKKQGKKQCSLFRHAVVQLHFQIPNRKFKIRYVLRLGLHLKTSRNRHRHQSFLKD